MANLQHQYKLSTLQFYCDELNMHTERIGDECEAGSKLKFLCFYKIIQTYHEGLFEIVIGTNNEDFEVFLAMCSSDFVMRWIENQIEYVLLMEEKL